MIELLVTIVEVHDKGLKVPKGVLVALRADDSGNLQDFLLELVESKADLLLQFLDFVMDHLPHHIVCQFQVLLVLLADLVRLLQLFLFVLLQGLYHVLPD